MQKLDDKILYSASDIVNFLECEQLTTLDIIDLDTPLRKTENDEQAKLIQAKGFAHEASFVQELRGRHVSFVDIAQANSNLNQKTQATLDAMRSGVEIIFQATLQDGCFIGHADFLRRVSRPSLLGEFSYEVLDTKLSRKTKGKFLIQLAFYTAIVAKLQGVEPRMMHVILGDHTERCFLCADYSRYFSTLVQRFLARIHQSDTETYPDPCGHCELCKWRGLCEEKRLTDDHLCQVANIRKTQIKKLQAAGLHTLEALGQLSLDVKIPKMDRKTLDKVRGQAALQLRARQSKQKQLEILSQEPHRGFVRLPRPDQGDLFFDMEGDPLEEGGLEYLFGLYFFENTAPRFKPFWAHSRAEEKRAFEKFMDFVTTHLIAHPGAHIYHYAAYEETALKKLMSLHGTREAEVDNLLRAGKMIDLYKVVRESIRVSEPRYSIKNIEHFYLETRSGEVTNAGASIVYYERWKELGDQQLLQDIEDYNREDVRSTYELREWLLTLRPADLLWANEQSDETLFIQVGEMSESEKRLILYREQLVDALPEDRNDWGATELRRELTFQLLDFHRRADKPLWWGMFSRQDMDEDQLVEDIDCLAGLTQDSDNPLRQEKRSIMYTCLFPEQETKLKSGDGAVCIDTLKTISDLHIDEDTRRVTFKYSPKNEPLPERFNIGPGGPISTSIITNAIFRFADSLIAQDDRYQAIAAILTQEMPRINGHEQGRPIVNESLDAMPQIITAIANLDQSYIFVQGPPGSGKTYIGSHVIVALLKQGYRVGVSSNSHKAINNLLKSVELVALAENIPFRGAKKSTSNKPDSMFNGQFIEDVFKKDDVISGDYQLVAGTAWLFSDDDMDQSFDFLFVDEAGQVALGNLVGMATCARNIVLLGDQMQLGQPIQGVHPGRSGESSLEYLLNGMATIPPDQGIFLKTTWRMHPDVCRFISDAVYDSRLEPEPQNARQVLLLGPEAHSALIPTGVKFVPIEHDGCSQRSYEEADLTCELVKSLLGQRYQDKSGNEHPLTLDNILVVAPYNMQVNLLKQVLPQGTRVGTVDKFQGQEAEVVIISMTTSSGDYLPRFISFLYSKNRLNVAISRAKCLALLIANPSLMAIRCSRPEEMALVNTLCWVKDYSLNNDSFIVIDNNKN
ncbi:MAG: TM0106 family RecB-like putative nuclease [Deltaproteobacteria bacterium]|nr:TM0106 family RecB-like putative nuclease [Deltaproteobacteria bacterium]